MSKSQNKTYLDKGIFWQNISKFVSTLKIFIQVTLKVKRERLIFPKLNLTSCFYIRCFQDELESAFAWVKTKKYILLTVFYGYFCVCWAKKDNKDRNIPQDSFSIRFFKNVASDKNIFRCQYLQWLLTYHELQILMKLHVFHWEYCFVWDLILKCIVLYSIHGWWASSSHFSERLLFFNVVLAQVCSIWFGNV